MDQRTPTGRPSSRNSYDRLRSQALNTTSLVFDIETYWDKDFTLTKLTPPEYILNDRFELHLCAVMLNGKSFIVEGPDFGKFLNSVDPTKTITVSHNALFDNCILAYRYGWVPKQMIDTLGLARTLLHHRLKRFSLGEVAKLLGLVNKTDLILKVKGLRADGIKAKGLWPAYQDYAMNDMRLCAQICNHLLPRMTKEELQVMDLVLRCAVQPRFYADTKLLESYLEDLRKVKEELLQRSGYDRASLLSTDKFKRVLEDLGVAVETKKSPRTGEDIPCFAKTDDFMDRLANSEDYHVQAVAAARLSQRSTIDETRAQKFLSISTLPWSNGHRLLPVPLRYGGAHTHRLCLAGHMQIVTIRNDAIETIHLDQLRDDDLVWDGKAFVSHGGLVFAGFKEVITYDSIVGTPDHRVWTVEYGYRPLAEAKTRGYHIARGDIPDTTRIDPSVFRIDSIQNQNPFFLRYMWATHAIQLGKLAESQPSTMQSMLQTFSNLEFVGLGLCTADGGSSTTALYEPEIPQLQGLRSARDRVSFFVCQDNDGMGFDEPRPKTERLLDRSHRQRRSLRTGQSALGNKKGIKYQQTPTWDIVDCGPHNRFMANGRIVHNSGEWKINLQNLPRDASKSKLRHALIAPPNHYVVSADLSQIEARLVAWLAGCTSLLEQFRNKEDPYARLAERIFVYKVNKTDQPIERFIGKTGILGLGYGCGVDRFHVMVLSQARQAGLELGNRFTYKIADRTVSTYRETYWEIPMLWRQLDAWLPTLNHGPERAVLGPRSWREDCDDGRHSLRLYNKGDLLVIEKGTIWLPNGMSLRYNVPDDKIYGAKLLENIIQALARIVVMQAALRLDKLGYRFSLQAHDELVFLVPTEQVDTARETILSEMIRPPVWAVDLPLAAEIGIGKSYGDCKS